MFYFLFPNHLFSVIINPISATKSIEHAVLITEKNSDPKWIDEVWNFYDEVNSEDLRICEDVNEGLECDVYTGGKIVPKYEATVHRYQKMIIDKMTS